MTNRSLPPPFISEPPIFHPFYEKEGGPISDPWKNWLNSVTRGTGFVIVQDYLISGGVRTQEIATLMALGGTTAERNSLDNARNAVIWYNTDTDRFNFREGGAWVTFAPIPA